MGEPVVVRRRTRRREDTDTESKHSMIMNPCDGDTIAPSVMQLTHSTDSSGLSSVQQECAAISINHPC